MAEANTPTRVPCGMEGSETVFPEADVQVDLPMP